MKIKLKNKKSRSVFQEAKRFLVGGVNSPVRAFTCLNRDPLPIERGKQAKIYDYDGNEYIDYVLSYGALILGHAHPVVINGIKETLDLGLGFGATNILESKLARYIQKAMPLLEKIRFVNSGTEAVMSALRLARAATGRNKIVKFRHSYHGHADYLLAESGSGLATIGLPQSKGVPSEFLQHTLIASYGNKTAIERIFQEQGDDIAAVIVEPVGGNYGVILPDADFLKYLRSITQKYKALLIFDEVITGFRFCFGSAADYLGIKPDLVCLGKIIGGGLPIGAYGGSEKIMQLLAPLGRVYQASTFAGNPIVMKAGLTTLSILESFKKDYRQLERMVAYLSKALEKEADIYGIALSVNYIGSMFSINFKNKKNFSTFYQGLLGEGVYFAPSQYESNFVSFAHNQEDIAKTISAIKRAFRSIRRRG